MDPAALRQKASDLLANGLKGLGEKKLSALGLPLLKQLAESIGATPSNNDTVESLVSMLLKKKRHGGIALHKPNPEMSECAKDVSKFTIVPKTTEACEPPSFRRPAARKPAPFRPCADMPLEETDAALSSKEYFQSPSFRRPSERDPPSCGHPTDTPLVTGSVFKRKQRISFVAFNSLKLRLDDRDLHSGFEELVKRFAEADVILVSEVSAGSQRSFQRINKLRSMLEECGDKWTSAVSAPSGPGNPEVHVVLVKAPIQILRSVTTSCANDVSLDYAPISVVIQDDRMGAFGKFVVTSVHFPPASRAKQRDSQISSFLQCYKSESAVRCDTPFTVQGARDARIGFPTHVIGGDFNCWIGDKKYETSTKGCVLLL